MAEHPLEQTQAQRLPYLDPGILEDRTRPADPVPMWLGRPFARNVARNERPLRDRARHILRTIRQSGWRS